MKFTLPVIILIILIFGVIGEILIYFNFNEVEDLIRIIIGVGRFAALLLLLKNGNFIKSKIFISLMSLFILLTGIGFLFKILHWPRADLMILIGFIGIPFIYFIHFLSKKYKNVIDYLKVIWLFTFSIGALFTILHWENGFLFLQIERVIFLLLFIIFVIQDSKKLKST